MNISSTIEKMKKLKFYGMSEAYENLIKSNLLDKYDYNELLAHLVESEYEKRYNRKLAILLKNANLRYQASFEEIDFSLKRDINKNIILKLNNCQFITEHQNIIITGTTGIGKSFIGCAIIHQACINQYKALYYNCRKLFLYLKLSRASGTYLKEINKLQKMDLLLLDDFGLEHLSSEDRLSLLEILEDRYCKKSTIIISQIPGV